MALSIGSQLSLQSVLYQGLMPAPAAASSLGSALRSQFYGSQASLILNRAPADERTQIYQGSVSRSYDLLRSTFALLSDPGHDPVFAPRDFSSSDTSVIRGYSKLWATPGTRTINIISIEPGTRMEVVSQYFTPTAEAEDDYNFRLGSNTFRLTQGGQSWDMSVTIGSSTTMRQLFDAAAAQFNGLAGSPVTATVKTDAPSGKIYLDVLSNAAGATFTLADTNTKKFIEKSELNTGQAANLPNDGGIIQYPSAELVTYKLIEGTPPTGFDWAGVKTQSQNSRKLLLDDGATVVWALKVGVASYAVSPQTTKIEDAITSFVNAWNQAFDFLTTNPSELTTPLAAKLNRTASTVAYSLGQMGISRGTNGLFSIDADKLEQWVTDWASSTSPGTRGLSQRGMPDGSYGLQKLRSLLTGSAGLATTAKQILSEFLTSPPRTAGRYTTNPTNPVAVAALRWTDYWETRGMIINTIG